MTHCIVLVKQVPDVSKISGDAFDPETGNLMRGKLPTVINDLDTQALAFATHLRALGGGGQIIALTMGPPAAADVLRYSISRVADTGVLLTDRVLGGADTYATASPLAFAVRRIVRDILGGTPNYFVIAGMQSVDGDTAQVPAQLAEALGLPCVSYATDVAYRQNRFVFSRIVSGGNEDVSPLAESAVITVAKYEHPLFPSVRGTREARRAELIQWSAADVEATVLGTKGSKTNVVRVFPPPPTSRRCEELKTPAAFAKQLLAAFNTVGGAHGAAEAGPAYRYPTRRTDAFDRSLEVTEKQSMGYQGMATQLHEHGVKSLSDITPEIKAQLKGTSNSAAGSVDGILEGFTRTEPQYNGDVWVMAELQAGDVLPATFELLGKARELADSLEKRVGVVLVGHNVHSLTKSIVEAGADDVFVVDHPLLAQFDPGPYRKVVAQVIEEKWPQIVLFAATPQGRTLAPMVSFRLHCGLTADCTGLEIRDNSRKDEIAILAQTRPALGGNVMATICTKDSKCQMATARPGVMRRLPPDPTRVGQIIQVPVALTDADRTLDILSEEGRAEQVHLDAPVLVSGGRGMQSKENYDHLIGDLSSALEKTLGVSVGRGASRAAIESGYTERAHQVGQTGTSVGPRVYVALAISGAIQHMIGVVNSGTIFAVNADPHAPIFRQCDYYMVGNAEDLVPEIVAHLEEN